MAFLLPPLLIIFLNSTLFLYGCISVFTRLGKKQRIVFVLAVVLILICVDRILLLRRMGLAQLLHFAFIVVLIAQLFVYALAKLFLRFTKKSRIIMACVIVACVGYTTAWFAPIGSLLGSSWQLSSDFRTNPRNTASAPSSIQFFDDGAGTKNDQNGYVSDFEWHFTTFDELAISTRYGSYIVRIHGFGTRLRLEGSIRGERTMGRFETRSDFTAHFRRGLMN